jgi:nucleotide-binding universal stress UspA family protein
MMAKRILVALEDHTDPILPLAAALARGTGATVRLFRVAPVEPLLEAASRRSVAALERARERLEAQMASDLAAATAGLDGIPVETAVRFGDPAVATASEAEGFGADLVAVSTNATRLGVFLAPRLGDAVARRGGPIPLLALQTRTRRA